MWTLWPTKDPLRPSATGWIAELGPTVAVVVCAAMGAVFFGSFYLLPTHIRSLPRQHPTHVSRHSRSPLAAPHYFLPHVFGYVACQILYRSAVAALLGITAPLVLVALGVPVRGPRRCQRWL